jgi:YjbR
MDSRVELFHRLALQLPGAVESSHMGHPDFRLNGRIFATLSAQEKGYGVLKLTSEQQQSFITEQPHAFSPVHGGWGRMGMTFVHLHEADEALIAGALSTAYHNLQKKQVAKKPAKKSTPLAKSAKPRRPRLQ